MSNTKPWEINSIPLKEKAKRGERENQKRRGERAEMDKLSQMNQLNLLNKQCQLQRLQAASKAKLEWANKNREEKVVGSGGH